MLQELAKYLSNFWTTTVAPSVKSALESGDKNAEKIVEAIRNKEISENVTVDNLYDVSSAIENAASATVEAINNIPKTVIPELDLSGISEGLKSLQDTVEKKETTVNVPETVVNVDTKSIVESVKSLEKLVKSLPTFKETAVIDYSEVLKSIKEGQDKTSISEVVKGLDVLASTEDIEAVVAAIAQLTAKEEPVYPFKFDEYGALKVSPDRVGGGGGGNNAELLQEIANNTAGSGSSAYTLLVEEASSTITYVGEASPGTATSAATWRVKKILDSGGSTTVSWADGASTFTKVWDDRASFSYS